MFNRLLCIVLTCLAIGVADSVRADDCGTAASSIASLQKVAVPGENAPEASSVTGSDRVALRDWVALGVVNLEAFLKEAKCRDKPIIVYLNGHPIRSLALLTDAVMDKLYFQLIRTNADRETWGSILASPTFTARPLNVTVGIEGERPLSTATSGDVSLLLTTVTWLPFIMAGACFIGLLVGFFLLMRQTNILRDGSPPEDAIAIVAGKFDPSRSVADCGTFSLAKLQAAWWFFIIVGAYLLIGIVTLDFYSSISSTALILLGIGAATVVGGTLIDVSKETPEAADARKKRIDELKVRIVHLDAAQVYCQLYARRLDAMNPPPSDVQVLTAQEELKLDGMINTYGPNMVQWLRNGFGSTCATIADIFELESLSESDEAIAAAAVAAGNPRPQADPQLIKIRAAYAGQPFVDLCHLKAITAAGGAAPQALQLKATSLPSFCSLIRDKSEFDLERSTAISRYRKLTNQSEGWFVDILSDANGVSFHRFQLFGWTLILGGVFAAGAYGELNMPVFDTTLMGLLGLSAATYLGLKVPEPTIPPK